MCKRTRLARITFVLVQPPREGRGFAVRPEEKPVQAKRRIKCTLALFVVFASLIMIIPPATRAAPPQDGPIIYYVQPGDTLFSISRRFGTTVGAIMSANGLTSDSIYVGQRLLVPVGTPSSLFPSTPLPTAQGGSSPTFQCTYSVQPRDTLFSIAYRYKVTVSALMQANFLYSPIIRVSQPISVPCLSPSSESFPIYTVQSGDNIFRIAIRYNTTIYAIAHANGLPNPNLIFTGQNLVIPYPGSFTWTQIPPTPIPAVTITAAADTPSSTPTATAVPPSAGSAAVALQDIAFVPSTLTVLRGTTVTWLNNDPFSHTVSSGVPGTLGTLFRSSPLGQGQSFSFTFTNPGTFTYFCEIHGVAMTGTINVQ